MSFITTAAESTRSHDSQEAKARFPQKSPSRDVDALALQRLMPRLRMVIENSCKTILADIRRVRLSISWQDQIVV